MHFRPFLLLSLTLIVLLSCSSNRALDQRITTHYLVRHAEKVDDSKDPELSAQGHARALALASRLQTADIRHIYSSDFKRTRGTVRPFATAKAQEITIYNPKDPNHLIDMLRNRPGHSSLIVGHSNSIPALVNQLIGADKYPHLDHDEYDKLFVIKCNKSWKCTAQIEKY